MAKGDKNYFTFAAGLNTDASPLTFPENFSVDERNFEILKDATRRRRRGITDEAGGSTYTLSGADIGDACRSFKWSDVAGDPNVNFVVVQHGANLHFYEDASTVSTGKLGFVLDLSQYVTDSSLSSAVNTLPIDAAFGRGHFFVTHKYLKPFYVKYTAATTTFTVTLIEIRERDFECVEDGVLSTTSPTTATDSHKYNLYNRGWLKTDLDAYFTAQSKFPSKNMVPWLGYRRVTTASVAESDWTKAFSPAKLVAELFQDASAPTGHFIRNPFDTSTITLPDSTATLPITTWTISGTGSGTRTITVTTDGNHGLSVTNSVSISGQIATYEGTYTGYFGFETLENYFSFSGVRTVTAVPSANTFEFTITFPSGFIGWNNQYLSKGSISVTFASNPTGYTTNFRPIATEFFAGRLWFAGTSNEKLATRIFFSQVIESDSQYGKCYQVADPTDQNISDLVDTDGGVIVIPEAASIHYLMAYSGSILVFASNGVWAIGEGQNGYFTATSYSVRKVSDIGSTGPGSIVLAENIPMYWSTSGIYALSQDSNSGFLSSQSVSVGKIDNFYREISYTSKQKAQAAYDDIEKRVVWLYNTTAPGDTVIPDTIYNGALVYNLRFEAWSPWAISGTSAAYTASLFAVKDTSFDTRLKFVGVTNSRTVLKIGDMGTLTYSDWNAGESSAYIVTGYDVAEAPQFRKTAPFVTVYQNKTETGYSLVGTDLVPVGESSLQMQAQWDWSDRSVAGKWGTAQQVYRHRRLYQPADETDGFDNGETLVVTRNKVRGRGRALSLKFSAGTGKDSWLLGWTVRFDILGDY